MTTHGRLIRHGLGCALSLWLLASSAHADWFRFTGTAMTTRIDLELWTDSATRAERIRDAVFAEFDHIDHQMSRYRDDSELSAVNREAAERPVKVSDGLFRVFQQAQKVSELSHGAFDISFGSVGYLYDYREKKQPTDAEVASRLSLINYHDIVLDPRAQTVRYTEHGVLADMGGIAKGYSVDRGIDILKANGITNARLSAGGDMRLLGDKRGKPWIVGVRDPRTESRNAVLLPLSDVAISTSGDYERFFIDESGKRVHHILSPKTGRPAKGIQSATIIGDKAFITDGLSTAVFVLGVEKGLAMVNKLPGVDAIIIDDEHRMHYSDGLMDPKAAPAAQ